MQAEAILGERIFLIHDFLSSEECDRYIAESESSGYDVAPISTTYGSVVRQDVRNNQRVMRDDRDLAADWFERARPFLPAQIGQWHAVGLNERFRFYRYDPGQTFRRHYDASYGRPNGEQSFLTLMVYLNAGYAGGTTEFYLADDRPVASVSPATGMALVFDHQLLHEGAIVESGRKYVLRTDVMYRRRK
jgi:hypothetical protein